ncbi:MAG: N-acetylneuraminate synthase family protein [Phycisphaerae bacterium]|nr:N-acetylneuraminate synthase family protein [Phycisphaerae bacterium]
MDGVLAVIIARAGSKGLPNKCVRSLADRAVIEYTFDHAQSARNIDAVCLTTDSREAAELAAARGIFVIARPQELASDTATVDAAVRHAVERYEAAHPDFRARMIVLLYGNVPLRPTDAIDRAIEHLRLTGATSVRTVAPVTKQHPDWLHRLDGDRLQKFRDNDIYRRQDLEPLYYHDGAVVALTRESLYTPPAHARDFHAFFGGDRRALLVRADETVDVDDEADLRLAEAILRSRAPRPVEMCGRRIGPGEPVWIIAEAGVNHDGRLDDARRLIDAARAAGADAVKFQFFRADRLVARSAPTCAYQRAHDRDATSQRDMLARLQLDDSQLRQLMEHAASTGIELLATPFGDDDVRILADLGVRVLKIASTDLVNAPLIDAAIVTGLPMVVSCGAAEIGEIDRAVCQMRRAGAADRLILLHCISRYPTPLTECNLAAIADLSRRAGVPVGFSDHTRESFTGALAVSAGATVLEKHLTLDRTAVGPDHFFSLEPRDLADYVAIARQAAAALGTGRIALCEGQREVRRVARGRLIAARPIRPDVPLTPDDLVVRRAEDGIDVAEYAAVIGRRTRMPVRPETPLTWAMLA